MIIFSTFASFAQIIYNTIMKSNEYFHSLNNYVSSLESHMDFLKTIPAPTFRTIEIDCTNLEEDLHKWNQYLLALGIYKGSSVLYYISFEGYDPKLIRKYCFR